MLHVSTQTLIQKLHELTLRGAVDWKESETGGVRLVTEGYLVELSDQPCGVRLLQADGRVLEEVTEDMLASAANADGRTFAEIVAEMTHEADRHAKGTEKAISAILGAVGAFEITGGRRATDKPATEAPSDIPDTSEDESPDTTEASIEEDDTSPSLQETPIDTQDETLSSADDVLTAAEDVSAQPPQEDILPDGDLPEDDEDIETKSAASDSFAHEAIAPEDADSSDAEEIDEISTFADQDLIDEPLEVEDQAEDAAEDEAEQASAMPTITPGVPFSIREHNDSPMEAAAVAAPVDDNADAPRHTDDAPPSLRHASPADDSEEAMAAAVGAMVAEINNEADDSAFDDDADMDAFLEEDDTEDDEGAPIAAPDISPDEARLSKVSANTLAPSSHGSAPVIREHGAFGSVSGSDTPSARIDISDRGASTDTPKASLTTRSDNDSPTVANDHHSWNDPVGATTAYNTATAAAYLPLQDRHDSEVDDDPDDAASTEDAADNTAVSSPSPNLVQKDADVAASTASQPSLKPRPPAPPGFIAPVTAPAEAVPFVSAAPAAPELRPASPPTAPADAPQTPQTPATKPAMKFHGKITSAGLAVSHGLGMMIEGVPEDVETRAQSMMKGVSERSEGSEQHASGKKSGGYKSWF